MSDSRQIESELSRTKDMLRQRASDVVHWATQIKSATNAGSLNNCLSSLQGRVDDLEHHVRDVIKLETDLKRAQEKERQEEEKSRRDADRKTNT